MNPAWKSVKRYGFCRPSWACLFYFTKVELETEYFERLVKRATAQQDIGYAMNHTYARRDPLDHGWPGWSNLTEPKQAQPNPNPTPDPSGEDDVED